MHFPVDQVTFNIRPSLLIVSVRLLQWWQMPTIRKKNIVIVPLSYWLCILDKERMLFFFRNNV